MREQIKTFAVRVRVACLFAAFSASVMLAGCATGQIDLAAAASDSGVATITGDGEYLVFWNKPRACGIKWVDSTSAEGMLGAKTVTVPEGMHSLAVTCWGSQMRQGELSFFAQAGHQYTISVKGGCIVAIDNANQAVVKSDCEPGAGL